MSPFVHPSAIVDDGANVADGVKIWHFCHVMSGATIGEGASLGQNVFVASDATVGARVRIQNNVSVYGGVTIEDDAFIGPSVVFTNVSRPRAFIDQKASFARTRIGRGATIGANATVTPGLDIGEYAFVAAGAVVTRDVVPHALVMGNPARRVGWVSRSGQRLPHGGRVHCPSTGETYLVTADRCALVGDESASAPAPATPIALSDVGPSNAASAEALHAALQRVLDAGRFILGEEVARLERALAELLGVAQVVGVSSGTDALLVSLLALDVGAGDEVITTPFSFVATASAIARAGATPIFVDVDPETMNLAPEAVARAISPRTKAVMPVHLFGAPCDSRVFEIAAASNLPVIEDAAQAILAHTARGFAGSLGATGCFSLFPTKNLGALGDGGFVTTNDVALADKLRLIRAHGAPRKDLSLIVGGNFRLDALQAAFVHEKLPRLAEQTARRIANASRYHAAFEKLTALVRPPLRAGDVFHHYVVRTDARDGLRAHLSARAIETGLYYERPIHRMPAFEASISLPVAEACAATVLALPVHPSLTDDEVTRVIEGVESFFAAR